MTKYYNPNRTRNLFDPASAAPYKLSRSKLELFINCPRCFYLDRRLGVAQPPGFPFALNSAVDALLKKEFDYYRQKGEAHPIMVKYGINAIPYASEKMDLWRNALTGGIAFLHAETNLFISGGIDDVWVAPSGELIVVDYKSTAKDGAITALDRDWQDGYKRQMEIYQWLFMQNGFSVFPTGYFVYCNADLSRNRFDNQLIFDATLIPYQGETAWVEKTIVDAKACLMHNEIPAPGTDCDFCRYRRATQEVEKKG